ncbi:hypothetical protein BDZ45DRAFT_668700 [Acephala macrosclerotiorum]|nr:hypothetical protein BDZ45DRAFT_668700 [Acephala macrosclerotiorum]
MADEAEDRLRQLTTLTPRRFHIPANPPLGVGLLIFGHENENYDEENLEEFFNISDQVRNCKPGIWTSRVRALANAEPELPDRECIIYWVSEGTIDIGQSAEDWKAYEKATRQSDADVKLSAIVPPGTKWRRFGSYFSDGGICTIVSTEYLTHKAARAVIFGDPESNEELGYGYYLETLSLNGADIGVSDEQEGFTIGGMNCMFFLLEFCGPANMGFSLPRCRGRTSSDCCGGREWTSYRGEVLPGTRRGGLGLRRHGGRFRI